MARTMARERVNGKRAAIYARVSDKSQAEDDKTSLSEQLGEMQAYCEQKGMTITARYQEVGRGWSKKRPEFQRMLADAKRERFDTIVCWKSDRLSRGMYPAAALMEVVEAPPDTARSRHRRHRHEDLRPHGRHRQDRAGQLPGESDYGQARIGQAGPDARRSRPLRIPHRRRRQTGDIRAGGRGRSAHLPHVRLRGFGRDRDLPAGDRRQRPSEESRLPVAQGIHQRHSRQGGLQGHLALRQGPLGRDGGRREGLSATGR